MEYSCLIKQEGRSLARLLVNSLTRQLIMFGVLMGGMFACQDEKYENVFGEAPVERRNAYFEQLRTTLVGAENGWNMQYFPAGDSPGYNLYALFKDSGEVILGAKNIYTGNIYQEYAGSYNLTTDNGPSLVFTTYNRALHPFCDPDINISTLADFEFIVFDLKDDTILLKGKRMKTDIRLIRLSDGMTGEEYVRRAEETKRLLFSAGSPDLILDVEDKTYFFSEGNTSIFKIREAGADTVITMPYIITADGFCLYKSLEVGDRRLRNFRLVDNRNGLICTDPGVNARFRKVTDNVSEFFLNSLTSISNVWTIDKNSLGGVFAGAYTQITDNCKDRYKEDFESLFFAYKTARRSITLSFKSGGKYEGAFNFAITPKEGQTDQIVFTNKNSADNNGNLYLKNVSGFDVFIDELGKGTYTISTESAMNVSSIKFTQESNPDNWFKVLLNSPTP